MSDIPLHNIRRQKPPEQAGIFYSYNSSMPKSRRTQDSKRDCNERHRDDSDKEAGLLDTQYDLEGEYERLSRVISPVCLLPLVSVYTMMILSRQAPVAIST